jgi:transketolase
MSTMTDMRTRFVETVEDLIEEDPRTAVVLADISADQFEETASRIRTGWSTSASARRSW